MKDFNIIRKRYSGLIRIIFILLLYLSPIVMFSQETISVTCSSCNGNGVMICPTCHGQGGSYFGNAIAGYSFMPCFSCHSAKKISCVMCGGSGSRVVAKPNPKCTNGIWDHSQLGACSYCWITVSDPYPYSGGYSGGGYSGGGSSSTNSHIRNTEQEKREILNRTYGERCRACGGSGKCHACNGSKVAHSFGNTYKCKVCRNGVCGVCNGTGKTSWNR